MSAGVRTPALAAAFLALIPLAGLIGVESAAATPLRVRPGDVFVLRPPPGPDAPDYAIFLGKTYPPLRVSGEDAPVFLLGIDLDARAGNEQILVRRLGGREERLPVTVVTRVFPEERLTLPREMVTPPKELEERILREQVLAAEVYRTSAHGQLWDGAFTRPLDNAAAGNFGRRRILNGIPKSPHGGQDYAAPAGTPVRAVAGGAVRLARDFYYSGLTLLVDHGAGLVSQYLHLEQTLVAEGDAVSAGQVIGRVGSTGRATGPHLHLGLRLFEQRVDPESLWGLFPPQSR